MQILPQTYTLSSNIKFKGEKENSSNQNREIGIKEIVATEIKSSLNMAFWGVALGSLAGLVGGFLLSSEHNFKLNSIGIGALVGGAIAMGVRSIKRSILNFKKD